MNGGPMKTLRSEQVFTRITTHERRFLDQRAARRSKDTGLRVTVSDVVREAIQSLMADTQKEND